MVLLQEGVEVVPFLEELREARQCVAETMIGRLASHVVHLGPPRHVAARASRADR
jgi:hypothetical protein